MAEKQTMKLVNAKNKSTVAKSRPVSAGETIAAPIVTLAALKKSEVKEMLATLSRKDRKLKVLIEKVEGGFALKIQEADSPFEAIAEAIVYQQLTGKAAATIFSRFKALFGDGKHPTPKQIVAAPETVLRSAGLSGSKIKALKDLADKSIKGHIPTFDDIEDMSDEEIIAALTAVKGVGTWTAHMFLMFRLGRLDVMPSGDYGVRKGFAITYGDAETLPAPAHMEEHAEIWRPYRSVGSWYMWRAVEIHRAESAGSASTKKSAPLKKAAAAKKPTKGKTASAKKSAGVKQKSQTKRR